jgi:hypothetical protein
VGAQQRLLAKITAGSSMINFHQPEIDRFCSLTHAPSAEFSFAFIDVLSEEKHLKNILEITFVGTGVTRWYDVSRPEWPARAVRDFQASKFLTA